jgi:hypothetical protein
VAAGQVVGPVHDVESGEGEREDDPGDDVDALGLGKGSVADGGLKTEADLFTTEDFKNWANAFISHCK